MDSEIFDTMHSIQPGATGTPPPRLVVGISAALGGIEALRILLRSLSTEVDMAFVVLQPLTSNHRDQITEALQRETTMPVVSVSEEIRLKPNCVYIAPSDRYITLNHDNLRPIGHKRSHRIRHPIDSFFRALAHDRHERCAGVILAGHGEDGAVGARCIMAAHGLVLVESSSAAPPRGDRSATRGDRIGGLLLPVDAMSAALTRHLAQDAILDETVADEAANPESVQKILYFRRETDGKKEKKVKENGQFRHKVRLIRHRKWRQIGSFCLKNINTHSPEFNKKCVENNNFHYEDLSYRRHFFRNPESFTALAGRMESLALAMCRRHDSPLRVWVPGCGTGEEAYSIAMILLERIEGQDTPPPLLIFATDIDPAALATARAGFYPESVAADISPERLDKFFSHEGSGFRVRRSLRRVVLFSEQNLLTDPPFSEVDLISCRNPLIHMEPASLRHVLSLFQFSLNNEGLLFLGECKTAEQSADWFVPLDLTHKIYSRSATLRRFPVAVPMSPPNLPCGMLCPHPAEFSTTRIGLDYATLTHRLLSDIYAPAAVLIDRKGLPLHYSGPIDLYLDFSAGHADSSLFILARCGLKGMLRRLVHKATRLTDADQISATIRYRRNESFISVRICVFPTIDPQYGEFLLLICFADEIALNEPSKPCGSDQADAPQRAHTEIKKMMAIDKSATPADLDMKSGRCAPEFSYDDVADGHHRIDGDLNTGRDIGERKPILDSMAGTLETMVRARTEKLETSNHELEEFAYVISHDLQEPLRMVTSYLQLIERRYHEQLDAEAHQFIEFAVDGARRMQAMICGLLELSRIGQDNIDLVPVPLGIPLNNALKALDPAITDSGAEIEVQAVMPVVLGDEICLGRLFQNLISNALKYRHPDRPLLIRVEAELTGSLWQIAVIDNGIGIAPENHDRIFRIFQRLHISDKIPGTGIGLTTARKIVTSHGGAIWVDSSPGKGAAFRFTLPKASAEKR